MEIPAGEKGSVTYTFAVEMHPQDLRLNLAAVLQDSEGVVFTKMVYNETVSVVEAPVSIFDPQMYVCHPPQSLYQALSQLTPSFL